MKRAQLFGPAIFVLLISGVFLPLRDSLAASATFTGTGLNADWFTPANWSNGAIPATSGTVTINNNSSALLSGGTSSLALFTIGGASAGSLAISASNSLLASTVGVVGSGGSILVSGSGARLTVSSTFALGSSGTDAVVTIQQGASGSFGFLSLGKTAGTQGTLLITGTGSALYTSGFLHYIGENGVGVVTVQDGASFSGTSLLIGGNVGSSGSMLVTGTGSTFTYGVVTVGSRGAGSLQIENGAVASLKGALIGDNASTVQSSVTVDGAGSSLDLTPGTGVSYLVRSSQGNSLTVSNGASFKAGLMYLSTGTGGTAFGQPVSGTASILATGLGTTFSATTLGLYTGGNFVVTDRASGTAGNFFVVDGSFAVSGSARWAGGLSVTSTNGMSISSGGIVTSGSATLGSTSGTAATSSGISGSNSLLAINAANRLFIYGNSTLNISNGGGLTNVGQAFVGYSSTNVSTQVLVTGSGSYWDSAGQINLTGNNGNVANLIVTDGGTVTATSISLTGSSRIYLGTGGLAGNLNANIILASAGGTLIADFTDFSTYSGTALASSGLVSLYKTNSGTLALTKNGNYGSTTVDNGMLWLSSPADLRSGTLTVSGTGQAATFLVTSGSLTTWGAAVGNGVLSVSGSSTAWTNVFNIATLQSGTIGISGGAKVNSGTFVAQGGLLSISGSNTSFLTNNAPMSITGSATVQLDQAASAIVGPLNISGDGALLSVNGTSTSFTLNSTVLTLNSGSIQVSNGGNFSSSGATLGISSGTGSISVSGTGATWNNSAFSSTTVIGSTGVGIVSVSNGGTAYAGTYVKIGGTASSGSGVVNISGPGSTFNAGYLTIGDAGNGSVNLGAGGLLSTTTLTLGSAAGSMGTLIQTGGTTTVNAGMNFGSGTSIYRLEGGVLSIFGSTTISPGSGSYLFELASGTVQLGNSSVGAADATLRIGTDSTINSGDIYGSSWTGVISGDGSLTKAGTGTLTLTGNNTFTGAITINAGFLQLGNGGTAGSVSGAIVNNSSLSINRSDAVTLANTISGAGYLNQIGSGTTILSGSNSYTGGTNINNGTLQISSDASLGGVSGTVTLNNATLQTTADIISNRTFDMTTGTSRTIDVAQNTVFSIGGSFYAQGALYKAGLGTLSLVGSDPFYYSSTNYIQSGTFQVSGTGGFHQMTDLYVASQSGQTATVQVVAGGTLSAYGQTIVGGSGAGSLSVSGSNSVFSGNVVTIGSSGTGNVTVNDGATLSAAGLIILGSGTSSFSYLHQTGGTISASSGVAFSSGTSVYLMEGGLLQIGGDIINSGGGNKTFEIASGTVQLIGDGLNAAQAATLDPGTTTIDTNGNSGTWSGVLSGSGALVKTGAGTLVIAANNTYLGDTTLKAGILAFATGGTLGSGTLTLAGNSALQASGAARTVANAITLSTGVTGTVSGNQALTLGGVVSGAGILAKAGNSTLTLSGSNAYSGGTTLSSGTLALAHNNALGSGALTVAGNSSVAASGAARTVANDVVLNATGTFNGPQDLTLSGVISGTGAVAKAGTNNLILTGSNTYAGTTTAAGGLLTIGNDKALSAGAVVLNGGTVQADASARSLGNTLNIAGFSGISGTSNLTFTGTTTNTMAGNPTLNISNTGTTTFGLFNLGTAATARTVTINSTAGITVIGTVAGVNGATSASALSKSGVGTLLLSGSNFYSGGTTISAGTLRASSSTTVLGTGTLTLSGGTLELANNTGLNYGNNTVISGNAAITSDILSGSTGVTGTLGTLSMGAQTLTINRGANVSSGTAGLTFTSGTLTGNATFTVANGALLTINGNLVGTNRNVTVNASGDMVVGGTVAVGTGTLLKSGTGTLTLSGTNSTFTGKTTVSAGTLAVTALGNLSANSSLGAPTTAANGTIDLGSGGTTATLKYLGAGSTSNRTINLAGTTGGGIIDASGSGALVLTGTVTSGAANAKTFTLTGANSGTNTISGLIVNGSGTVAVAKTGDGTWSLTGTSNTYTGATTIADGLLNAAAIQVAGSKSSLGNATSAVILGDATNSGTLAYTGTDTAYTRGFTVNAGGGGFNVTAAAQTVTINTGGISNAGLFTIGGAGNATISSVISGTGSVAMNGTGLLTLSGSNSYSGGTTLNSGTLSVGHNNALGTSSIVVNGGVYLIQIGVTATNSVTVSSGTVSHAIAALGNLANTVNATSHLSGGDDTSAAVLAGTASSATTLVTAFSATSTATNDLYRRSDVYSFQGTGTDIFTLQLSFTATSPDTYLGWLSGNQWVNAVDGNTGNNATLAQQGFVGSFAAFQALYGTDLSLYLGAWGTDTTGGTTSTWAVINHNSDFAAVPEPSTWLLLGLGLSVVLFFRRRTA